MKKTFLILAMSLMAIMISAAPSYAHKSKSHPSVKHAIRELHEAKEILAKLSPDAGGHIAKASNAVDQAFQELSAIKELPVTKP